MAVSTCPVPRSPFRSQGVPHRSWQLRLLDEGVSATRSYADVAPSSCWEMREVVTLTSFLVWTLRVRKSPRLLLLGRSSMACSRTALSAWGPPGTAAAAAPSIITGASREDTLRPRTTNVWPLASIGTRCTDFVESSRRRRHGFALSKMTPCPCFNRLPTERIGRRTFRIVKATFRRAGLPPKPRFTRRHP